MAAASIAVKVAFVVALAVVFGARADAQTFSYGLQKIWGDGSRHCAFTSLVKYKGVYYCTFREGYNHVFNEQGEADGKVRVIRSTDGDNWENVCLIERKGYDLRDPKLCETPDGKLMLLLACVLYKNQQLVSTVSMVAFSTDGQKFSKLQKVKSKELQNDDMWLWRVTWHKGVGYGVSYYRDLNKQVATLFTTTDGVSYKIMKTFDVPDAPNEATVRFTKDDKMIIILRRDGGKRSAVMLSADAPYTDWKMKDLGFHVGGPDAIVLDDGRLIIGGRSEYIPYHGKMVLYTGTLDGNFCETMVLPSGGDTSYPSFLLVGDKLWVTYYSTHETNKPSIYLAKIPLEYFFYR